MTYYIGFSLLDVWEPAKVPFCTLGFVKAMVEHGEQPQGLAPSEGLQWRLNESVSALASPDRPPSFVGGHQGVPPLSRKVLHRLSHGHSGGAVSSRRDPVKYQFRPLLAHLT